MLAVKIWAPATKCLRCAFKAGKELYLRRSAHRWYGNESSEDCSFSLAGKVRFAGITYSNLVINFIWLLLELIILNKKWYGLRFHHFALFITVPYVVWVKKNATQRRTFTRYLFQWRKSMEWDFEFPLSSLPSHPFSSRSRRRWRIIVHTKQSCETIERLWKDCG